MATPGRPRASGIPGRSGIATPSRSRSSSVVQGANDAEYASRAFVDALKTNNPAQHRSGRLSDASNYSQDPSASSRPPSTSVSARTKTPVRPQSRQSDAAFRSASRAARPFEVGDNVRIESLGYEGRLRFVGEIDGKVGVWAGVELSGGFHGKGKNDGSVDGKQYFMCPPKCGVFVALTKLSAPTVGSYRPSSVASSAGRSTPSISGRATPSTSRSARLSSASTGRTTPSTGRITPASGIGRATPSAGRKSFKAPLAVTPGRPLPSTTTPSGTRASKYANMTAKQLSDRDRISRSSMDGSPTRSKYSIPSPMKPPSSPSRPSVSPFTTPKAASRPSIGVPTPRARIPSSVAMPPPPSPSARPKKLSNVSALSDSDRVASQEQLPEDTEALELLQSRIQALEYETDRLRSEASQSSTDEVEGLTSQLDEAQKSLQRLTTENASLIKDASDAQSQAQSAIAEQEALRQSLERQKTEAELSNKGLESQLTESTTLVNSLKEAMAALQGQGEETDSVLKAKASEISLLEVRLRQMTQELESEKRDRKELVMQVDELRHAGQETIALYEERLSSAESERYELETRIQALEASPASRGNLAASSSGGVSGPSSAEQIDNESLRDQVQHYQNQIAAMEDSMQELRSNSERDDAAVQERMKKLKEKEELMRKELQDNRQQVQRMAKSESSSKDRVEEIEAALRDSTGALELARAEVETLRAQLADFGISDDELGEGKNAKEGAESSHRDSARLQDEISKLQLKLDEFYAQEAELERKSNQLADGEDELIELRSLVTSLENENSHLKTVNASHESSVLSLQQALEDKILDTDSTKKRSNRDVAINNGVQEPVNGTLGNSVSKQDGQLAKEEIKGLKHIVQDLQKENRKLESENHNLASEVDQLREEVRILEGSLDDPQSSTLSAVSNADGDADQLRKKISDIEMKNARTIRDLNKEISELEALVESKIYREDELEQEVERLRDKMSRQKKSSKSSISSSDSRLRIDTSANSPAESREAVCEICERPGHDIFNCDLLKDESPTSARSSVDSGELWCVDCESKGHVAADCPHSLDVF